MNRSGSSIRKLLLGCALAAVLVGPVRTTAAQTNGDSQPDKQEIAVHYSLYWENFKNGNYKDALPDLRWILENAPSFPQNDDRNFERAVEAYDSLAARTEDPAQRRAYLDSALVLFDRVVPTLTAIDAEVDEFIWARDKGRFIQSHDALREELADEAMDAYLKMYELDPKRTDPYYIDVIFKYYYSQGDIGQALDFLAEVLETRGDEPEIVEVVQRYEEVIPPEERLQFFLDQLEKNPDDVELIGKVVTLAKEQENIELVRQFAPRLLEMEPTPETMRLLMQIYLEDGEYEKAVELFEQLENMAGAELKAEDYLNMGIAQQSMGRYSPARQYYQQALQINPDLSRARKAIADLYATAVSDCGVSGRQESAVFWLIYDAYVAAGDATSANRYRSVFPTAEDIFYTPEWTEGQSTSVSYTCNGLTISGTTTVRKRP